MGKRFFPDNETARQIPCLIFLQGLPKITKYLLIPADNPHLIQEILVYINT